VHFVLNQEEQREKERREREMEEWRRRDAEQLAERRRNAARFISEDGDNEQEPNPDVSSPEDGPDDPDVPY
jgi:hypothetical protein